MAKQSSVNLDITNNADGFDISGGTTVRKLGITGGDVTIAGSGSAVVTFPTTSTTIAGLGITQSFSALQTFTAGISAAGGVTFAGTLQGTTANFTGLVSSAGGFSGAGTNLTNVAKLNTSNTFSAGSYLTVNSVGMFAGRTQVTGNSIIFTEGYDDGTTTLLGQPGSGAANTVSLPQTTGIVALTNSTVASFNGLTGAVTGVTVGGTNVFTALNTFNAGISTAGATFSGDIAVNGGDITTTSTTATLFNANATSLDILNTQSSGFTLNIGRASSFSGTKTINIGGNVGAGAISEIAIGSASSASRVSILGGVTLGGVPGAVVRVYSSSLDVSAISTFSNTVAMSSTSSHTGLASFAGGISAAGITVSGSIVSGGTTGILLQPGSGVLRVIGGISASEGFTFGNISGTTWMVFVPKTSCNSGGLWIRDGNLQIAGSVLTSGAGSFSYSPCGEQFVVTGYSTFQNSYNYQSGRSPLRLNGAPTQSVPIFAAYKQTSDGAQLTNTFTTTNMVAGIDQNGALFSSVGISAAGGVTFAGTLKGVTASFTGLLSASSGISASGAIFTGDVQASSLFVDNISSVSGQVNVDNRSNGRVAIGDYAANGNNTSIFVRDGFSILDITNPYGDIRIGDVNALDSGYYITYSSINTILDGGGNDMSNFSSIFANNAIYENNRRVTTNARSWFL